MWYEPKGQKFLFPQCKASNNSRSIKHIAVIFACSMGFSGTVDRMVWPLSLSRDPKWTRVTKCTHLWVVLPYIRRQSCYYYLLLWPTCLSSHCFLWLWRRLRSLSDSGSSSGLQSSFSAGAGAPGMGGPYKLAEHRYGREELLALYKMTSSVTPDLQDTTVMLPKPVPPLALVPMSEDEQVITNITAISWSFLWYNI